VSATDFRKKARKRTKELHIVPNGTCERKAETVARRLADTVLDMADFDEPEVERVAKLVKQIREGRGA
jgi:hypothetical protein